MFNPYSGVKTSILFMDRSLAKWTDQVLFVKIENDGFDLGAQRRLIKSSQLAEALTVPRTRLLESPDVNLSGYRYRTPAVRDIGKWPMVRLGEVVKTIIPPKKIPKSDYGKAGGYPIIDQSENAVAGWTDDRGATIEITKPVVIFGDHTCAIKYSDVVFAQGADGIKILETNGFLLPRFLYFWLHTFPIQTEGYKRHFSKLVETEISLPPLEKQERIVAELEGYR